MKNLGSGIQKRRDETESSKDIRLTSTDNANRRKERLKAIPPRYADTDIDSPLLAEHPFAQAAKDYDLMSGKSVIFLGVSGQGKTRAAYHIIKRAIEDDFASCVVSTAELEQENDDHFHWPFLLIDDIMGPISKKGMARLYHIIEHRHGNMNPTIITGNGNIDMLNEHLGEMGIQMMRRIFSDDALLISSHEPK